MKNMTAIFLVLLSGCATHFTVPSKEALRYPLPQLEASSETTLYRSSLSRQALHKGGVALFGILKGGPQGLRQTAAFELFQGLRAFFPEERVVPRSDLLRRARAMSRSFELESGLKTYEERRVFDPGWLKKWGAIEGVRYLFIAQVTAIDKHTATRTMTRGEAGVAGKVKVFSSGPVHIPYDVTKEVSLSGEVWDVTCGKAVWMGTSQAEVTETVKRERVRVEDIFTSVTRNLISELDEAMRHRGVEKTGLASVGIGSDC